MTKVSTQNSGVAKGTLRPAIEGLVLGGFACAAALANTNLIRERAVQAVVDEIKDGLVRLADVAATTIDGDAHREFRDESQRASAGYRDTIAPLEEIRKAAKYVPYLYTNVEENGKVYFVLNPSPQGDNDNDGKPDLAPALMQPYPEASDELKEALSEQKSTVSVDFYTDQWGTFVSAYSPFYDSQHKFVGTLGMDLDLTGLEARLEPVQIAIRRTAFTGTVIAVLFGTSMWFIRRRAHQIEVQRGELALELARTRDLLRDQHAHANQRFVVLDQMWLAEVKQDAGEKDKNRERMESLFRLVRDASLARAGQLDRRNEDFSVREILAQRKSDFELLSHPPESDDLHIDHQIPSQLRGDGEMLGRIVGNLEYLCIESPELRGWKIAVDLQAEELKSVQISLRILPESKGEHDLAQAIKLFAALEDQEPSGARVAVVASCTAELIKCLGGRMETQSNDAAIAFIIPMEKDLAGS